MEDSTYGLEFIPNQPIIFDLETDNCRNILDGGQCRKWKRDTVIEFQMKRRPCGDNLICTDTTPTYGADEVINGDFDTDTVWVKGTGWAIAAGVATHTPGNTDSIYQIIGTMVYGVTYRVTFDIIGATAGSIYPQLGDGAGASQGTAETTNATHTQVLVNGDLIDSDILQFFPSSDFDGSIDNVTIEPISYCMNGAGWVYDADTDTYGHLTGTNVSLDVVTPYITTNQWYMITILISDRTTGTARLICGTNASEWFDQDGEYVRVLYSATSNLLAVEPDTDFDGKVRIVSVYEMSTPSQIDLVDASDTSITVADLLPYHTLLGDRINVKFSLAQLLLDGAIPGNVTLPACYRIAVDSICSPVGGNMVTNGQFNGGSGNTITGWTSMNAPGMVDYSFTNMQVERTGPSNPLAPKFRNQTNPLMTAGDYLLVFNITKNTNTSSIAVRFLLDGVMASPWFTAMATGNSYLFTGYVPGLGAPINTQCLIAEYSFSYDGVITTGQIAVDTVRLFKMSSAVQPKISNCITFVEDADLACYKLMEARSSCYNHGFDFRDFTLRMYVPMMRWGATYPLKDTTHVYSNGNNERPSSQRDKIWSAKTDKVDEIAHDCLSVMLLQDEFYADAERFFFKSKQYNLEHNKSGMFNLSRANFELSKITSTVFGNKCLDCQDISNTVDCIDACENALGAVGEEAGTPGWFYDPAEAMLEYWDGDEFTDEMPCTGYIYVNGEMLIFNDVTGSWVSFIEILSITDDGTDATLTAIIPSGCAAQVQISTNSGGEWTAVTPMKTAQQLLTGITFDLPADPFWVILYVRCGVCTYYSPINTDYE